MVSGRVGDRIWNFVLVFFLLELFFYIIGFYIDKENCFI